MPARAGMGKYRLNMLYRWDVIGHTKELQEIEKDLATGNIHHAYLFVGPEKIGKFRIAKSLARAVQCDSNFCKKCPICIQINKKCHPDTMELDDDGESVKINAIREIIMRLNMTGQSKHKILLIENVKRLTEEASNCILKTLEEPPEKTIFIFTCNQLQDVPSTITSRMRIVHFKKLPDSVLRGALKERYPEIEEELLDQVLVLSLGRSGKAIQLLSDSATFHELKDFYEHVRFLDEKAGIATRLQSVQEMSQDPVKIKTFLALLAYHFRQKLFSEKSFERKKRAISILEAAHKTGNLLARNVNPRLLLENLMLEL